MEGFHFSSVQRLLLTSLRAELKVPAITPGMLWRGIYTPGPQVQLYCALIHHLLTEISNHCPTAAALVTEAPFASELLKCRKL